MKNKILITPLLRRSITWITPCKRSVARGKHSSGNSVGVKPTTGLVGRAQIPANRKYHLFGHGMFVAVYVSYTVYCAAFYRPFIPDAWINVAVWGWFLVFNIGLAYLNIYFLMPKFLYRRQYLIYVISLIGCLLWMALSLANLSDFLDMVYGSGQFLRTLQSPRLVIPLSFACPMAIALYRRRHNSLLRIHQLESVTIQSELDQLKKQINPHFLFNMLNNAMVLIKTGSMEASQVLTKFKDLLNYQLTFSAEEETLLIDEIRFLRDYLNLERIRRDRFDVDITIEGEIDDIRVPPLLFIPFVENAVKHNPESNDYLSYVRIRFRLADGKLNFTCINSMPGEPIPVNEHESGLGLVNIKRRLSLLYPEKHELSIEFQPDCFQVNLQLPL